MKYQIAGKIIAVLGFGRTGMACVDFLLEKGASVIVNDIKKRPEFDSEKIKLYEQQGVRFVFGRHSPGICLESDSVIISPGIDPCWLPRAEMEQRKIELISEIELAFRFADGKIVGVTGTNGKTTVTTLLGQIFERAGFSVAVCGNIGFPFIQAVRQRQSYDYFIIEISSFQLEAISLFKARGALLLNISADHFDRYPGIKEYIAAKWNIFKNQGKSDWAILNGNQHYFWKEFPEIQSAKWEFSSSNTVMRGCFVRDEYIYFVDSEKEEALMSVHDIALPGVHNRENIMACIIAGLQEGISRELIIKTVKEFKGLPHRMEIVAVKRGVTFINDSKATNPDAVIKALAGFGKNVIIILGGKDKQLGYDELRDPVQKHVKAAILIGEAKNLICSAIKDTGIPIRDAETMQEAVKTAFELSENGDIILLSPACASFDMFIDYADRGNIFKRSVYEIIGQNLDGGLTQ